MNNNNIHRNLPDAEYRSINGLSATQLKTLKRSPYHLRHSLDNPSSPTPEMVLGTAVHAAWMEPQKFAETYIRSEKFDRRTKDGKEAAARFAEQNVGKTVIDSDDWDTLESMVANLNDAFGFLLADCDVELSIVVPDPKYNLNLKGRIDLYHAKSKTIYDLKTCQGADYGSFSRDVFKNDYALQAWHYKYIAEVAGLEVERFVFIPTEKKAPYSCAGYPIEFNPLFKHLWQERHEGLRKTWAQSLASKTYPKPHELEERTIVIS
jgi:hypothetical protein